MKWVKQTAGVLCLVVVGFLSVGVVRALTGLPATLDRLEETIWLEDGRCDPANDGELVTILLDPNTLGNACDTDLGLTFTSPVVKRYVDEFVVYQKSLTGRGIEWRWQPVPNFDSRTLRNKSFAGDNPDGEMLSLDPVYSPMLPGGRNVDLSDLTPESQKKAEEMFETYLSGGYRWLSDAPAVCFGDDLTIDGRLGGFEEYEGCIRIRYAAAFEEPKVLAITGLQQGRMLIRDESLDLRPVAEGVTSPEGLIRDTVAGVAGGSLLMQLIILFILYFGLKWLGVLPVGVMDLVYRRLERTERGRAVAERLRSQFRGRRRD